jgi:hypothetical protein
MRSPQALFTNQKGEQSSLDNVCERCLHNGPAWLASLSCAGNWYLRKVAGMQAPYRALHVRTALETLSAAPSIELARLGTLNGALPLSPDANSFSAV